MRREEINKNTGKKNKIDNNANKNYQLKINTITANKNEK